MVGACGSDDGGNDAPVGPSGPVELVIDGFSNNQNQSFDRDADEVVLSCDGTINVRFGPRSGTSLKNWALRPPEACGSYKQCGYILLTLTPEAGGSPKRIAGASTTLLVPASPGRQRLEADLYTGDGEPFLQDKLPVADSLSAEFVAPVDCEPETTGSGGTGVGGSTANGGASGTSTTTGAGGAPGGAAGDAGAAGQASDGGAAGAVQG